jgi:SAM-dependent methyltransferase
MLIFSRFARYLKSLLYMPVVLQRQSLNIAKILNLLDQRGNAGALRDVKSRIQLIASTGDSDSRYVNERLEALTSHEIEAKNALDLMIGYIENELPPDEREHARNHLVRYLMTYDMAPRGPGLLLDVAHSPIYTAPLTKLKQWTVEQVPILAIDYEKDRLPFSDGSMDGVLLCEVIEHFVDDPLYCLIEINRILKNKGFLLLSTPNVASWFSLYRLLAHKHPYRWPVYAHGHKNAKNHIHSREYVPNEIRDLIFASGFEVSKLITIDYGICPAYPPLPEADPSERGETIFCLGIKKSLPRKRRYTPLYLSDQDFDKFE